MAEGPFLKNESAVRTFFSAGNIAVQTSRHQTGRIPTTTLMLIHRNGTRISRQYIQMEAFAPIFMAKVRMFALLSVRIRGNGDGTVTAVARNEFALGSAVIPVSLTLYRVSDAQDLSLRAVAASAQTDDLNFLASLEASAAVEGTAYYYAEIVYSVYGEEEVLASEVVCYDAEGNRVGEPRG